MYFLLQKMSVFVDIFIPHQYTACMNTTVLENLGLSKKEADVYLAALSVGTASVMHIAKAAKMQRSTTYFHINKLLEDSLLETIVIGKKTYYRAAPLDMLQRRAEKNLQLVQEHMPEFEALRNATGGESRMRILEGKDAMFAVYDEITQAASIRFWADLVSFEKTFGDAFQALSSAIAKNNIRTKEIIPDTQEARNSSKRYAAVAGKYYASRIATRGAIHNDSAIYGDTVAMFYMHGAQLYVILIQEPSIVATMRTLFDMAWDSAQPFIPKRSS